MEELKNFKKLDKSEMKLINGGMTTWCRRRSTNVEDLRPGAPSTPDTGFLNANGCWVYAGMAWNSHPDYPPSRSIFG